MTLSPTELLTLAGILRSLTRIQALDTNERRDALTAVAESLDLRSRERERPEPEQRGYREAAHVMRVLVLDLEPWMRRAERELTDPEELRALLRSGVSALDTRRAILRAVQGFASYGGLSVREEMFLAWLALLWRETPLDPGADAVASLSAIPPSDRVVLGGLLDAMLTASGLDETGKARALEAAASALDTTPEALDPLILAARQQIRGEGHLRALVSFGVTLTRSREAIVRAVLVASYVGGIEPDEEALLRWLAASWSMV